MADLGVSQPRLSQVVAEAGPRICRMGRARATAYAATRELSGLGPSLPLHQIDESGRVHEYGRLHVLAERDRYWLERSDRRDELVRGLPTFAEDLSPQGYLGGSFPARNPDLGLPIRVRDWDNDQKLIAVARRGEDGFGNVVVGAESLDRFLAAETRSSTPGQYPGIGRESLLGQPGSSAGGEQPKFTAFVEGRHVLVKFADGDGSAAGRWRDLLACEALALDIVRRAGLPAAEARLHDVLGGRYLEVNRFDRVGERGRRGAVSLAAINNQYLSSDYSWTKAAACLRTERFADVDAESLDRMVWLDAFGDLIANSDRHFGNLSFLSDESSGRWRLRLAPVYDMLPMWFAPRGTALADRPFVPGPPTSDNYTHWADAARWAADFWGEAVGLQTVGDDMRRICEASGAAVEAMRRRHGA